jgi:hypothetical protein
MKLALPLFFVLISKPLLATTILLTGTIQTSMVSEIQTGSEYSIRFDVNLDATDSDSSPDVGLYAGGFSNVEFIHPQSAYFGYAPTMDIQIDLISGEMKTWSAQQHSFPVLDGYDISNPANLITLRFTETFGTDALFNPLTREISLADSEIQLSWFTIIGGTPYLFGVVGNIDSIVAIPEPQSLGILVSIIISGITVILRRTRYKSSSFKSAE